VIQTDPVPVMAESVSALNPGSSTGVVEGSNQGFSVTTLPSISRVTGVVQQGSSFPDVGSQHPSGQGVGKRSSWVYHITLCGRPFGGYA